MHQTPGSPLAAGPCGQPCNEPCSEPCDDQPAVIGGGISGWGRLLEAALFNALDVCFDDVMAEPKRMLIIGGCRQRRLSRHIALMLPATEMVTVDPDAHQVQKAKEEICCRFKFEHAPLEALPFEDDAFDVTIAHNFFAYPQQWEKGLAEAARVTKGNLLISTHRPVLWKLTRGLGGLNRGMQELGIEVPDRLPSRFDFLSQLWIYGKVKTKLAPFPWDVYMTAMRPMKEERLVLAAS